MPGYFSVWKNPKDYIPRVMGYVFISPQGEGQGVAVCDSFDLEAVS